MVRESPLWPSRWGEDRSALPLSIYLFTGRCMGLWMPGADTHGWVFSSCTYMYDHFSSCTLLRMRIYMIWISVNTKYSPRMYGGVKMYLLVLVLSVEWVKEILNKEGAGVSRVAVQWTIGKQLFVILSWLRINIAYNKKSICNFWNRTKFKFACLLI